MRYRLLFILFAFAFFSCKDNIADKSKRNENWVWWVDAKTGKAGWIPVNKGEPVKNGKYTRFYFNGNVYQKGRLVDGMDADTVFYYDKNGHLQYYKTVKDDSLGYFIHDGPVKIFYADGNTWAVGIVKNHTYGDKWISYLKNGKPYFIKNLNRDTGWETSYYDNGKLKDSDYYEGEKSFNIKHWYENGQLKTTNEFKAGNFNGFQKQYYPSGRLKGIGTWVNGKGTGKGKSWYEDGKIQSVVERINGELNGLQIIYYENGNIKAEGNYKNDKLDGEIKRYDENGKLIADYIFKNGVQVQSKIKESLKH